MKQTNSFNYSRRSRWLLALLFALFVGISPTWADGKTLPYSYGFEDNNLATDGWTKAGSSIPTNTAITMDAKRSGDRGFQFWYSKNPPQYLISPELATSEVTLNLSFWYKNGNSYTETFNVGYSTSNSETGSFTWLEDTDITAPSSWTEYKKTLPAGTKYVAIKYTANDQFKLWIDDFSVSEVEAYPKPTDFIFTGYTSTTASFSWTKGGDETAWQIAYSTIQGFDAGSVSPVNVTTNPYTLEGLTAETTYYARIRADYGGGNYSKWSDEISFKPSAAINTTINEGSQTNTYVPIYGAYLDSGDAKTQFILPSTSLAEVNGRQITGMTFYGTESTAGKLSQNTIDIYMSETANNAISSLADWSSLEKVYSGSMTISEGKMTIILDDGFDYSGGNLLIGFKQTGGTTWVTTTWTGVSSTGASYGGYSSTLSQQNFLPKMTITSMPQTATVKKPKNLAASATATTTATLGWTDGEDGLTEWQIAYSTATDFNPDSEGTKVAADANPFTLTELTAATTYYAYVRAKKAEEYSSWSNKAEFTTLSAVPIIGLSTTNHNFGMVSDADAQALTLTISNTGGAALTGLTVTPTSGFAVTDMEGNALTTTEIAASATLSVKVKMSALGQQDGTITIDGNEIDAQEVTVSGYMLDNSKIAETFTSAVPEHWTEYAYKTSYSTYNWSYSADGAYNTNENSTLSTPKITVAEGQALVVYGKLKSNATSGYILVEGSSDNGETWTAYSKKLDYAAFSNTTNVFQLITLDDIPTTINKLRFKCYYAYLNTINGFTYAPDPVLSLYSDEECTAAISTMVSKSFGLITEAQSEKYYIKNTGTGQIDLTVNEPTGFTATIDDAALTNNEVATLTITMPATEGTHDDAIVVTAKNHDTDDVLGTFTVNATGALRDANKFYQEFNTTSLPDGWTTDGNWSYNTTNGAYTQAWYIDQGTLARLKSPMLTVAAGEKFIIEAKGLSTNNTSYQHIVLQYSEDGSNWTTFSDDFGTTTSEDPTNWKSFTATLPNEVEAGNYYIGILASQADIRLFYGGEIVHGANFAINTDGTTQDFGSVRFGTTAEKTYTITNNGDKDMFIGITSPTGFTAEMQGNVENDNNVYFTKPAGWGAPNIYYWNDGGDWPGKAMTKAYTNEYGQDVYYYERPADAEGIIFNDGISGHQTVDIIGETLNSNAFYISGGQDGSGHYNVATWICKNRVPAGQTNVLTVSMNTASSGNKSGNVVLAFEALNATSFTIPCTGNVKDENYLYVDFSEGKPEGWTSGDNWAFTSGYAAQTSTTTPSALITTPLTVAENETMTFKVRRNSTGNKLLKVSYSDNGGVTWTEKYSETVFGSGFTTVELTEIPAGKVILKFYGNNIQLDDIEGFTKTTAPAIALSEVIEESTTAVAYNDTKDFGYLSANSTATYRVKNIGNTTLNAALSVTEGKGLTVSPANISIEAGQTADVTVTLAYGEPYGTRDEMNMTIDSEDWVGDFVVNFEANLVDPTDFVEDFTGGKPAGWYLDTWAVANGEASINVGTAKAMITEKIGAEAGKNELSFDTKLAYNYGYGTYKLNVYTSTDRKNWGEAKKEVTLTNEVQHITLDALADGEYYVKFEAANAIIDNITGVKKLDAPAHDLYLASATLPTDDITPIDTYTATVNVASLRANETVTAELYFGETKVSEENLTINNGSTETINISGQAPAAGTYDVYVKVYNANVSVQTENASVTVADKVELSITNFAAVSTAVTADENNEFSAEFNVTVKNTGSTSFAANEVSVTVTDLAENPYQTATWTPGETIYLKAGNYTADGAKLAIYRWSTNEDQEWAFFTGGTDDIYTASLNGKDNFIIVRLKKSGDDNYDSTNGGLNWNNKYNQSNDLTAAAGVVFENNGYKEDKLNLTQSNNFIAGMSATINVSVTAVAGEGGELKFNVKEDIADVYWYPTTGIYATVNVTAAPVIELDETVGTIAYTGNNRKVSLARTIVNGWNTVCLPFAMTEEQISAMFGEEAKVFSFEGMNGSNLNFNLATEMAAGTPYLLHTTTDALLSNVISGVTVIDAVAETDYFKGTFTPMPAGSLEGKYGVSSANKIQMGNANTTMKGFRAYFQDISASARIAIFDETTGITRIYGADEIFGKDDKVYDLNGRRVETAKKGVYIVNGRKMVVK